MFEFFSHLLQIVSGCLHVALLVILVMIAFGVLGLVGSAVTAATSSLRNRKKPLLGSQLGFYHMHESSAFERRHSVKTRTLGGAILADNTAVQEMVASKPVAVLKFDGDTMATGRKGFASLVDEVLINKEKLGGAVVVVSSPGGGVSEYGQMFAEMKRMRDASVDLTVCVDTYAASGGYLMSLPANKIVAAPFAVVGSIGVVSEFLNYRELLTRLGVKPVTRTAGQFKRTLTPTSEITEEATEKFDDQLKAIHRQFIAVVHQYRPQVNVDEVCTGDHWTAQESVAANLGLVDELGTSQDYLFKLNQEKDLLILSGKVNRFERGIFRFLTSLIDHYVVRITSRFQSL